MSPFALAGMISPKLKRIAMTAALVVFVALASGTLGYCRGHTAGVAEMQAALDRANLKATQEKARADELAAAQRLTDTIAVNRQEQELRHAIQSTPDTAPDAVRVRLGCERLRRAGQDTTRLPACR